MKDILNICSEQFEKLENLDFDKRVEMVNSIRECLLEYSPFKSEPVDFVRWVKTEDVVANDYNPNAVAPPEMDLLKLSILSDGFTQPIVSTEEGGQIVVIDGFHRNRVSKECDEVSEKLNGYAPVVQIRESQEGRTDRMASTIRHNRARGKHRVESMSDIVLELKRRNWSDKKISKQLGMDADEVLRLAQITGLVESMKGEEFSSSWDAIEFEDVNEETIDEQNISSL